MCSCASADLAGAKASPEVEAAVRANEALVRESLMLRHLSLASSGVDEATENVDNEYMCPICLVRARHMERLGQRLGPVLPPQLGREQNVDC